MTPFMMKHVQSYMLQNSEMANVASLAGTVSSEVPKQSNAQTTDPFSTAPDQEEQEMEQASSLDIIDKKYAPKQETQDT